jgi:hypothetical protein
MKTSAEIKPLTLFSACQRLASYASTVQRRKAPADVKREEEARLLVMRALSILELQVPDSIVPGVPVKTGLAGLLARMISTGGEDNQAAAVAQPKLDETSSTKSPKFAMRVSGDFVEMPNLIGFLSGQGKTGTLEIATANEVFTIEFEAGDIVHAQCSRTPEGQRMGDILVKRGAITREALEGARSDSKGGRLGDVLLERGLVSKEMLVAALQSQIQLFFNRVFDAPVQRATFWAGPPLFADKEVRLNATSLLLEGARVSDETNWFRKSELSPGTPQE